MHDSQNFGRRETRSTGRTKENGGSGEPPRRWRLGYSISNGIEFVFG